MIPLASFFTIRHSTNFSLAEAAASSNNNKDNNKKD